MSLDSFLKYEIDGESIDLMAMMQRNKTFELSALSFYYVPHYQIGGTNL